MRTNKFLVIALAAAGLMTACSNNEEVKTTQGNGISFRLQGGMPEAKTTASTIDNVDAFVVYGSDNADPLLFNGVSVVRKAGTGDAFTYAPNRYYDEAATNTNAAYIAYSPISAKMNAAVTNILGATSTFEYTVPAPATDGTTSQVDLLFTAKATTTASTNVALNFIHALSRVFVAAKNTTDDPVTIKKLTLKKLHKTGEITVNAGGAGWLWATIGGTTDYEYVLAPTGVIVPGDGTSAAYKLVTSMEQGMMVLPQTLDTDCVLEVEYEFATLATQTKQFDIAGVIPAFAINSQYQINITFTGTAITFDITVTDFGTPITEVNAPVKP